MFNYRVTVRINERMYKSLEKVEDKNKFIRNAIDEKLTRRVRENKNDKELNKFINNINSLAPEEYFVNIEEQNELLKSQMIKQNDLLIRIVRYLDQYQDEKTLDYVQDIGLLLDKTSDNYWDIISLKLKREDEKTQNEEAIQAREDKESKKRFLARIKKKEQEQKEFEQIKKADDERLFQEEMMEQIISERIQEANKREEIKLAELEEERQTQEQKSERYRKKQCEECGREDVLITEEQNGIRGKFCIICGHFEDPTK